MNIYKSFLPISIILIALSLSVDCFSQGKKISRSGQHTTQKAKEAPKKQNVTKNKQGNGQKSGSKSTPYSSPSTEEIIRRNSPNKIEQSNSSLTIQPGRHIQKTLYTFAPGEMILDKEYASSKNLSNDSWIMLTEITVNGKDQTRLINNGKVIEEANWIDVLSYDPASNDIVYCFRRANGDGYMHVGGRDIGPNTSMGNRWVNMENPKQARWLYTKMDTWFMQDYNGHTIRLGEANYLPSNHTYSSSNGLYSLKFPSKSSVSIGSITYKFLPVEPEKLELNSIDIYNNGSWEVSGSYKPYDSSNWKWFDVVCVNGKLTDIAGEEKFLHPTRGILDYDSKNFPQSYRSSNPFAMRDFDYDKRDDRDYGELATSFILNGKNGRDEFMSNWKYDYVLINDRKIGNEAAIDAWYDQAANAFVWITIEGNRLVKNVYGL